MRMTAGFASQCVCAKAERYGSLNTDLPLNEVIKQSASGVLAVTIFTCALHNIDSLAMVL